MHAADEHELKRIPTADDFVHTSEDLREKATLHSCLTVMGEGIEQKNDAAKCNAYATRSRGRFAVAMPVSFASFVWGSLVCPSTHYEAHDPRAVMLGEMHPGSRA